MNIIDANNIYENKMPDDGPKIGFLETFFGILTSPKKTFESLYDEEGFTVIVYGILAVFLSNFGKIEAGSISILNIVGVEVIGFISWFFVGLFIIFFSTVFKTPNNNFARLLGFTGLSSIPFLLLAPINLISSLNTNIYLFFEVLISVWAFILFWISLAQSFRLEAWRVLLMAVIPFLLGVFLFTFMLANLLGFLLSGMFIKKY